MIEQLDDVLRHLLTAELGLAVSQVSFEPPNNDWRQQVAQLSLNLHLVEITENRRLRSNEMIRELVDGQINERMGPTRLNCRYLVSAWNPLNVAIAVEPTLVEHRLLYEAAQVLLDASPLDAKAIYGGAGLPAGFPAEFAEIPLPTQVVPETSFAKLSDFWMRMDWVWKAVIDLTVTIPVLAPSRISGPPVSTIVEQMLAAGRPGSREEVVVIGGVVRNAAGQPVAGAWVRLVELEQTTRSDAAGRFIFSGLNRGTYTLVSGGMGLSAPPRTVTVPSQTGEYDLVLA